MQSFASCAVGSVGSFARLLAGALVLTAVTACGPSTTTPEPQTCVTDVDCVALGAGYRCVQSECRVASDAGGIDGSVSLVDAGDTGGGGDTGARVDAAADTGAHDGGDGGASEVDGGDAGVAADDDAGGGTSDIDGGPAPDASMPDAGAACGMEASCAAGTSCFDGRCDRVVDVGVGHTHVCAVLASGSVYCWGLNDVGQLGTPQFRDYDRPTRIMLPDDQLAMTPSAPSVGQPTRHAIAAGVAHTCVVTRDQRLYCWGWGWAGHFGNDLPYDSTVPVRGAPLDVRWVDVSAGWGHTCALTDTGDAYCFGYNAYREVAPTDSSWSITAPRLVESNVRRISANDHTTCLVRTNGTVRCFGSNDFGQLGTIDPADVDHEVTGITDVRDVQVAITHTCATVGAQGALWCWGTDDEQVLNRGGGVTFYPPAARGPTAVASFVNGNGYSCVTRSGASDAVECWGSGWLGRATGVFGATTPTPTALADASGRVIRGGTMIATRDATSCVVLRTGGLRCWGGDVHGQLTRTPMFYPTPMVVNDPDGDPYVADEIVAATEGTCARRGAIVRCVGDNNGYRFSYQTQTRTGDFTQSEGLVEPAQLSIANYHGCARTGTGLTCFGLDDEGQVGNGAGREGSLPASAVTGSAAMNVLSVVTGEKYTCLLGGDRRVYCFGDDRSVIGPATAPRTAPGPAIATNSAGTSYLENVMQIAGGADAMCAITNGAARCWGGPGYITLASGDRAYATAITGLTSQVSDIGVGSEHACALRNGTVYCWGRSLYGETGGARDNVRSTPTAVAVPESPVLDIEAFDRRTCAIAGANRHLYCWGQGGSGQIGDGQFDHRTQPTRVGTLEGVQSVAVGRAHTCALVGSAPSTVYCWGADYYGVLAQHRTVYSYRPGPVEGLPDPA